MPVKILSDLQRECVFPQSKHPEVVTIGLVTIQSQGALNRGFTLI